MRHKSRTEELLQLAKGSRAPVCFPGWKTPEEFSESSWKVTSQFSSDEDMGGNREIWAQIWILDKLLQPQMCSREERGLLGCPDSPPSLGMLHLAERIGIRSFSCPG